MHRKIGLLLIFLLVSLSGQNLRWTYEAGYEETTTSAKATLQLTSSATRRAHPLWISINCPSAVCALTVIRGGTAATATAGTPVGTQVEVPAGEALWFTSSNSTGGTSMPIQRLSQGLVTLDMSDYEIRAGERLSWVVAGSSQLVSIKLGYEEYPR